MKIKILLIAVLLCFTVFCGCGSKKDVSSNDLSSSNSVVNDADENATATDDANSAEAEPLSNDVILPDEVDTDTLVDTGSEINAAVSDVDVEYTKQYIQSLVGAGFTLDYEFEVAEGAQFSLSKGDILVSVLFKNDEMTIYATNE